MAAPPGGTRAIAVAVALAVGAIGCHRRPSTPPEVPGDMAWITTTDDPLQWRTAGFIELTTPVRPPTTEDGRAHIVVVLKVPAGQPLRLDLAAPDRPQPSFVLPVGATAARIEYRGPAHRPDAPVDPSWRVLDVRQFDWGADGIDCTVLRPDGDGRLVGLRWRCGEIADARASALLASYVHDGRFAGPTSRAGRAHAAHRIALINDCRACHQFHRAEDRRVSALVQRGTDGGGLFSLGAVFRDEDPVERYRPVDTNAGDPVMTPVCPGNEIDVAAARCRDGLRPRLRLDLARGVRGRHPHALQLCATRHALVALLAPPDRAAVEAALTACGPTVGAPD